MKKEMKSMKTKMIGYRAALALILGSLGATVVAEAQQTYDYGSAADVAYQQVQPMDQFSVWCDQVTQELLQTQALGWNLYRRQLYTQVTTEVTAALQRAIGSMNIPGSAYRPATYNEIMRTLDLINALKATNPSLPGSNNPILKAKMIAYVALQRISFISYVKDAVDINFNNPCRRGCGGGFDTGAYEQALSLTAIQQMRIAQDYSSIVGADGMVYPINDTPYYFVIISMAARWAAQDLSTSLFATSFSCAVMNLRTLGTRAASYQAMLGDVSAVQEIHSIVESLISSMYQRPYGCGYRW
jgi:hypothetical protein